jgi:tetratricopeptide (TPR) repeat protein
MNRTTGVLLLLLCLIFQQGISGQQPASQESAGDHLKRADEFTGSGNLRGAIGEFRAAIRLDPSNANAHWGVAKALHAENPHVVVPTLAVFFLRSKMQDALKEYRTAMNLDRRLRDDKTESAERHVRHASAYLGRDFGHWYAYPCGDVSDNLVNHCMDDAAAEYRIALLLDPDYVPAHVGLGDYMEGDNTRAPHTNMDSYDHVLEDDLKQSAAVAASLIYHLAISNERVPRKPLPSQ